MSPIHGLHPISREITAFIAHIRGLSNQDATLTLRGEAPVLTAPSFADDTGNAQSWTQNTAIAPIAVPEASGDPTPTYAAIGSLPAGIGFNTSTRVISGTPTSTGSGTIRIRATNSEGSDDWTVGYTTATAPDLTIDAPTRSPTGNLTPGEQFVFKRRGTKFW